MDNVDNVDKHVDTTNIERKIFFENPQFKPKNGRTCVLEGACGYPQKNPQSTTVEGVDKTVDNVDNYLRRRFSPIFTTSPAPIVINRSPWVQFFNKNFSTSSKVEKW